MARNHSDSQLRLAWQTIAPPRGNPHGPLPLLLVLLTLVTGFVDAFSYLELGHAFVANMTGNVIFISFAVGGAPGFVWWASLLAIVTFSLGAFIGGRIVHSFGAHRARHVLAATVSQAMLVIAGFVAAVLLPAPYTPAGYVVLIVLLGVAMGIQNSTARALAVPDLTTTVLTLTITGIASDASTGGMNGSRLGRRLVSIVSMFVGGLLGVLLVEAGLAPLSLLSAAVILIAVSIVASSAVRSSDEWTRVR